MDEVALVETWLARYRSPNTRTAYARDIAVFGAWLAPTGRTILEATNRDVANYSAALTAGPISPATARRRLAALSALFEYAQNSNARPSNPIHGVPRDNTPTAPTPHLEHDLSELVWRAAEGHGPRSATLVGLLLFDGFRLDEALAIDLADIRRSGARVAVVRPPRSAAVLHPRTAAAVLRSRRGRPDGPLLVGDAPGRQGVRLSRYGAHFMIRQLGERAGLEMRLSANHLRATHRARLSAPDSGVGHI